MLVKGSHLFETKRRDEHTMAFQKSQQEQDESVLLSRMWKRESKAGKTYLGGSITAKVLAELENLLRQNKDGRATLLVFTNENKKKESDPDYRLVAMPPREKNGSGSKSF